MLIFFTLWMKGIFMCRPSSMVFSEMRPKVLRMPRSVDLMV